MSMQLLTQPERSNVEPDFPRKNNNKVTNLTRKNHRTTRKAESKEISAIKKEKEKIFQRN